MWKDNIIRMMVGRVYIRLTGQSIDEVGQGIYDFVTFSVVVYNLIDP